MQPRNLVHATMSERNVIETDMWGRWPEKLTYNSHHFMYNAHYPYNDGIEPANITLRERLAPQITQRPRTSSSMTRRTT